MFKPVSLLSALFLLFGLCGFALAPSGDAPDNAPPEATQADPAPAEATSPAPVEAPAALDQNAVADNETAPSTDDGFVEPDPNAPVIAIQPGVRSVYVVPIEGEIGGPQLYILRRALKDAIANGVDTVVLKMDTPGGRLDITLEMMEALDNFEGETITYVDDDAISAGSYIAVATDSIYFSPKGKMGAAEAVTGQGGDIDESMQRKINSYLRAVVRVLSETHRYRADVQRAMMDPEFELEIDGHVIKPAGELLTITASEAARQYGDPPQPLLATGIVNSVDQLLGERYGADNYEIREFHLTWSEEFAKWFARIAPVLVSIGILLIIIEVKTPHFGLIGGLGIALVLIAFLSNSFAGLAGNEPILLFFLGLLLIAAELLFFPGVLVMLILGLLSIVAAVLWSMADIWPTPDGGFTISTEALETAVKNSLLALIVAGAGFALLLKFLPGSPLFRRFISQGEVGGPSDIDTGGGSSSAGQTGLPDLGARGTVVRDLHPLGMIEIDGQQFQARCSNGEIRRGQPVVVIQRGSFALVVEPCDPQS